MPVNAKEKAFFDGLAKKSKQSAEKPITEKTLQESRNMVSTVIWLLAKSKKRPFKEAFALARDGYKIPLRIFNSHLPSNAPLLIYFMGNGFIYDQLEVNSLICSRIAENLPMKIIIPNTRLAPENPLPTPIYDAIDAANYIVTNAAHFDIFTKKIIAVGYCTGATSALAAAENTVFDKVILLNGIYDYTFQNKKYSDHENQDISFNAEFMEHIIKHQALSNDDKMNPLYSPLLKNNFKHLPKITILVAEFDRNRSSSEALYEKLADNGVKVSKIILQGQTHNTMIFYESILEGKDPALVVAAEALDYQ